MKNDYSVRYEIIDFVQINESNQIFQSNTAFILIIKYPKFVLHKHEEKKLHFILCAVHTLYIARE